MSSDAAQAAAAFSETFRSCKYAFLSVAISCNDSLVIQLTMSSNAAQAAAAAANMKTALQLQRYYRQLQREYSDDVSGGKGKPLSEHPFKYLAATAVWCCLLMVGLTIDQSVQSVIDARFKTSSIAYLWSLPNPENKTRQIQIEYRPGDCTPTYHDQALGSSRSSAPPAENLVSNYLTHAHSCPEQDSGASCLCSLNTKQELVSSRC